MQGLANLCQTFDREQEVCLARIQKLEKELATEKELHLSFLTTTVSAVPGSEKGDPPSHSTGGGDLASVRVESSVG